MTADRSAYAPCFSYGVSASSDSETGYTVNYERQGCEAGVQVPLLPDPRASRAAIADERRPRMTPELEALYARALQEALRRQILRDGFKTSLQQQALPTRCACQHDQLWYPDVDNLIERPP